MDLKGSASSPVPGDSGRVGRGKREREGQRGEEKKEKEKQGGAAY